MEQYLSAIRDVIETGHWADNRTGIRTKFKHGLMMRFDLADGFPVVTTKKLAWKSCFGEMLGFLRGYDNAAQFRALGCNVWNQNANKNQTWLGNPSRKGKDDLGRIYGVQARRWQASYAADEPCLMSAVDQLKHVYRQLKDNKDDRRLIVTHWNPGELDQMALPPCHLLFQFGLRPFDTGYALDLFIYIRSNDLGLGAPFNIAGYAWLLSVMAHVTGHLPGELIYFAWNYHVYENHIEQLKEQLKKEPRKLPMLHIPPRIRTLSDLESWVVPEDFTLVNYGPHPAIKMPMAV